MDLITIMWIVFVVGYLLIALAEKIHIDKAPTAFMTGGILMFMAASRPSPNFAEQLIHSASETMGIVGFLMCAMALVEILVHYQFFDWLRYQITRTGYGNIGQFWMIGIATFLFSSFLDNLTTTIVMLRLASMFFSGRSLFYMVCTIISAANSGGAWSPVGDVTSFMIWQSGKYTPLEVITTTILPSLASFLVVAGLLSRGISQANDDASGEMVKKLHWSQWVVIILCLISFGGPFLAVRAGIPALFGIGLGLGITWFVQESMKKRVIQETTMDVKINALIEKIDIPSVFFFMGILGAVTALHTVGTLHSITHILYGNNGERIVFGHSILGLVSAIFDNVPLTAIAIQTLEGGSGELWSLLAFTVGTGGSMLIIGSAAGVVAIGIVEKLREERGSNFVPALSFWAYAKVASLPNLLGYSVGIAVWYLQRM
jgi:Na+/H+ antiporter NhaD/arsenite permease-like protein